ncbi:MAG: bacillithiol biosynthesis BshC, partial [Gemmatimonadota bacterium]|nr:bacillithiol biosynthesis BshC [Gemmatimonadota bacterium]
MAGSALTQVALARESPEWFAAIPSTAEEWEERATLIRSSLLGESWLTALAPAFGFGTVASDRLEQAAASGFVVTAGQQPGLFGGPLYTWWKALSALAVADRLQVLTGLPVAPIFWAATDDSDFAESAVTTVATAEGAERIEMPVPAGGSIALARMRLGDVSAQLQQVARAAGSASDSAVLDSVRNAYREEATIGGAYVSILRAHLEPMGISVLDAAHESVRIAAHPLLIRALEKSKAIDSALTDRSRSLEDAGFPAQVNIVGG